MIWRIRDRATFEALRHSGQRARRGFVTVTYAAIGEAPVPRVAYVTGKRAGNAVARNRLRRRLRAAAADVVAQLEPGAYLVAAGPGATRLSYEELKREVSAAMTSACRSGRL
ncbi:MAG: ribonuclease P protein component [Acidimicrobiales bacterium]